MTEIVHGIVHGKTITLLQDPGYADGQEVQVVLTPVADASAAGEGIRRSAGGWSDYPEMDAVMEEIHHSRKDERRQQGMQ